MPCWYVAWPSGTRHSFGLELGSHFCRPPAGIKLIKADDFKTWWFTIEVMGESLYAVRPTPLLLLRASIQGQELIVVGT